MGLLNLMQNVFSSKKYKASNELTEPVDPAESEYLIKRSDVLDQVESTIDMEMLKELIGRVFKTDNIIMKSSNAIALKATIINLSRSKDEHYEINWNPTIFQAMLNGTELFLNDLEAHPNIAASVNYDASIDIPNLPGIPSFEEALNALNASIETIKISFSDPISRRYAITREIQNEFHEIEENVEVLKKYIKNMD